MKSELEMARIQAQTERIQMQTELFRLQTAQRAAEQDWLLREMSRSETTNNYQNSKDAEDAAAQAAADRDEEVARAAVRQADTVYLGLTSTLPLLVGFLIARRARASGGLMKYEEKFGVMLMICALLLGMLAISISENWALRLDAMQNMMVQLKIRILPENDSPFAPAMVDVHTKHVLLALIAVAAYGFTTYLGITPAWKKRLIKPSQSSESAGQPRAKPSENILLDRLAGDGDGKPL